MPLVSPQELFHRAHQEQFAVGYFESWNLESLQGALDAAEQTRSPLVIGFNGEFLSEPDRTHTERLSLYGALGKAAAEAATVPCVFIFNECPLDEWVIQAASEGFNIIMPLETAAGLADYQSRTRKIVEHAHALNVSVEAELGELPCGATGVIEEGAGMTDPEVAAQFVSETGVDLIAVSCGNVHINVNGRQPLDLKHLQKIAASVGDAKLVLHGGTGIDDASLKSAIEIGVVKVNFGTYLKKAYLAAIRHALANNEINPHKLLGMGKSEDVMNAGRQAVCEAIKERLPVLGCMGKA